MKNGKSATMNGVPTKAMEPSLMAKTKAIVTAPLSNDKEKLKAQVSEMLALKKELTSLSTMFSGIQKLSDKDLDSLSLEGLKEHAEKIIKVLEPLLDDSAVFIMADPSTDFVSELNNIDFAKLIGGPLQAAITAQSNASISSINFIKEVGFDEDNQVRYVDFEYDEKTGELDADGNEILRKRQIKVPLLSMVTVPSLRIETVDVDFNVKLNSVQSRNVSNKLGINASASGGWGPVKFKVSASYQRSASTGVKVEKQYTMNVKVKATQDEIPLGLEKILNLLSN